MRAHRRGLFIIMRGEPMSDADGKQELVGLARSIDALFTGDSTTTRPTPELLDAVEGPEAASGVEVPESASAVEASDSTSAMEAPEAAPAVEVQEAASAVEVPAPTPAVEAPEAASAVEAEAASDMKVPEAVSAVEAREEPSAVGARRDAPASLDIANASEHAPGLDAGLDSGLDSRLDIAVDAFLAGDHARASGIEMLGAQMRDSKNVEPVGRSLARLALAAGEPPDPSILAVARSIASPVVLGWLARRMGAERDETRRAEYRQVCRVLGDDMARAVRDDLAESTDRLARRIHCETLVDMGAPGRRVIVGMVHDDNRFLVRNAVAILGEIGGEGAVELVTSALANPDARVRREALRSLAKLGDPEAGALVVGFLDDPDAEVRMAAAVAAGELRVERALRSLIGMLDACKDADECVLLIRALGQLGDPGAVTSIEKHAVRSLFSKPPTDVRIAAYRALHQIGTPHARRLLNQAVSDKDPEVRAAVKEMLHMR